MSLLTSIPNATVFEKADSVFLITDDNFCIKAIYKPKPSSWGFDWRLVEENDDYVPKTLAHLTLRQQISDYLNVQKLKKRPVWKKGAKPA